MVHVYGIKIVLQPQLSSISYAAVAMRSISQKRTSIQALILLRFSVTACPLLNSSNTTYPHASLYILVCVQMDNQDSVRSLLKRTETELNVRVTDALRKQEDPLQRQRLLVEEERLKYLNEEELIIQQLQSVEVFRSNVCIIIT